MLKSSVLLISLTPFFSYSEEQMINVLSDKDAHYFILDKNIKDGHSDIILRVERDGNSTYYHKSYDCVKNEVVTYGSGKTISSIQENGTVIQSTMIVPSSVDDFVMNAACIKN